MNNYAQGDRISYRMEIGVHGGGGYYVGELAPHVFMSTREAYGAHVRYKFNSRWAIKTQGIRQRVAYIDTDTINNSIWNIDVTADCNFFNFGQRDFDITQVSPFVFAGVGCAMFKTDTTGINRYVPYIPFGIGLKWKFHDRMQLQLAWQHNIHMFGNGDSLDGYSDQYPIRQEEKKKNFLNNDVTSTFTLSFVVEFVKYQTKNRNIRY